jgi:hypothetical protein
MYHDHVLKVQFIRFKRRISQMMASSNVIIDYEVVAIGLIERLRMFVISDAQIGDVGRHENDIIADALGWFGDADGLIDAFVEGGYLERCSNHRLVYPNWEKEAPRFIRGNLTRHKREFAVAVPPTEQVEEKQAEEVKPDENQQRINPHQKRIKIPPGGGGLAHQNDVKQAAQEQAALEQGALQLQLRLQSNHNPITHTPSNNEFDDAGLDADGFERFWKVAHHRVGKLAAKKAFCRAVAQVMKSRDITKVQAQQWLIHRMDLFAGTPKAKPKDRTPIHPTTWLNEGRYDDDDSTWNEKRVDAGKDYDPNADNFGEGF